MMAILLYTVLATSLFLIYKNDGKEGLATAAVMLMLISGLSAIGGILSMSVVPYNPITEPLLLEGIFHLIVILGISVITIAIIRFKDVYKKQ